MVRNQNRVFGRVLEYELRANSRPQLAPAERMSSSSAPTSLPMTWFMFWMVRSGHLPVACGA